MPTSVNANTPKELTTVHYKDFDEAIKICNELLKNDKNAIIYFSKSDLTSAFRQLPMKRKCWVYLVMKAYHPVTGKVAYFVDKCLPFGAAISCAIFQKVSDALSHLVEFHTGQRNVNYLDDFLFLALLQALCNLQLDVFMAICNTIRLPVAFEKTVLAGTRIIFLGLLIDGWNRKVGIPVDKIERAVQLLQHLIKKKKATLREMQQLCGFLNFISKCLIPGRVFLRRMYMIGNHLSKPHLHVNLIKEDRLDMEMWLEFLLEPEVFTRDFFDFDSKTYYSPLDFFTDASGNKNLGAGGYYMDNWFILQWDEKFIAENNPSINYLELFALSVGFLLWGDRQKNRKVTIFCDNQSVMYMVNNGTSSCRNCLVLLRIITLKCLQWNVKLRVRYVRSEQNTYADLLSRNRYDLFRKRAREENKQFKSKPEKLPEMLWPMNKIWLKNQKNSRQVAKTKQSNA